MSLLAYAKQFFGHGQITWCRGKSLGVKIGNFVPKMKQFFSHWLYKSTVYLSRWRMAQFLWIKSLPDNDAVELKYRERCFHTGVQNQLTGPRESGCDFNSAVFILFCLVILINSLKPRKMAAVSQTTFSNAFSWLKMFEFRLRFHWSLLLRVQLTIIQHWFR